MFSSRVMRWMGRITLDVLRLGIVWRAIRGAFSSVAQSSRSRPFSREAQPSAMTSDDEIVDTNLDAIDASANGKDPGAGTDSKRIGPPGSPVLVKEARDE
jgi:hypothetical protein